MAASELTRACSQLRRASALSAAAAAFGRHGRVALFVGGALALLVRTLDGDTTSVWWLPASALGCAVASALWIGRTARPAAGTAAVWLDVHGGASGEVVTESELGASAWSAHAARHIELALTKLPSAPWNSMARSLSLAALFALAALWVPLPARPAGPAPFVAGRGLERVEEKFAALDEALELDPLIAEEFRERLERVEQSAKDERFDTTFEALDRLEERLDEQAARALDAAQRADEALSQAASDPHLDHAQEALESALEQMREAGLAKGLNAQTEQSLGASLESLPPGVQLSSAQLAKLSSELRGSLGARFAKLDAARMIDPSKLRELLDAQLGDGGQYGALDPDHECDENCRKPGGTCKGRGAACSGDASHSANPGAGGVTRGRADARLDFSGETPQGAERFAEKALPPGALDLANSALLGIGAGAPLEGATAESSQQTATQLSAGDASWKRRLAPQHRDAVRNFFGSDGR